MAKLSRTFGENVPPELITVGHHRLEYGGEATDSDETLVTVKIGDSKKLSLETHGEYFLDLKALPPPPKSSRMKHSSFVLKSPRAPAFHSHTPSESYTSKKRGSERDLAFSKLTQHLSTDSSNSKNEDTYRRQNGWSGEWNQGDMREVMDKLRHL